MLIIFPFSDPVIICCLYIFIRFPPFLAGKSFVHLYLTPPGNKVRSQWFTKNFYLFSMTSGSTPISCQKTRLGIWIMVVHITDNVQVEKNLITLICNCLIYVEEFHRWYGKSVKYPLINVHLILKMGFYMQSICNISYHICIPQRGNLKSSPFL